MTQNNNTDSVHKGGIIISWRNYYTLTCTGVKLRVSVGGGRGYSVNVPIVILSKKGI